MTKIGIIGVGFVGDAVFNSLSTKVDVNIGTTDIGTTDIGTTDIEVVCYDKYKYGGIGKLEDMFDCNVVFVCLPTPYIEDLDAYDLTPFHEVCQRLHESHYSGIVLVKSTVSPGTCQEMADKYQLKIVHNPEFLTARTARQDFDQQSHIVLGTTTYPTEAEIKYLTQLYQSLYPNAFISVVKSIESESMKMFVNNFYSVKVQMFTEFYLLCQKLNADYEVVKDLMLKNGWISPHHVTIPGPDGQLSYGGLCFPKDTKSLLALMKKLKTPCQVLQATVSERDEMRDD